LIAEILSDGASLMIGEARGALAPDGRYEIAVSVAEAWRRRTLGTQFLRILAGHAGSLGIHDLVADVFRSNEAAMARKLGFGFAAPVADARLMRFTMNIAHREDRRYCGRNGLVHPRARPGLAG
jgi:RimJ/RimL family protein N-acetyltransferase